MDAPSNEVLAERNENMIKEIDELKVEVKAGFKAVDNKISLVRTAIDQMNTSILHQLDRLNTRTIRTDEKVRSNSERISKIERVGWWVIATILGLVIASIYSTIQ